MKKTTAALAAGGLVALVSAAPAPAQVEDYRDIEYPELAEFEIPRPEIYDLPNGMKVFLMEDHELPLIQVIVRVRTGGAWEPAEKTGLAGLTGSVQRTGGIGGPRAMSGDELDDFLEARAASVETSIGQNVGFASMDVLKDDFDEVFQVFHDVLRYPAFAEDKLEVAKAQARSAVARRNDDVTSITAREFSRLVYGTDSPLSRLTEYATLDAVSRDDLVAWHGAHYHPNNMYLGVVGDFDSAAMKEKIAAVFGGWPAGPAFDREPVEFESERTPGVYFIEKTDVTQANIRLGHLGIRLQNPDFFAVQVLNEILGGSFASRLVKSVRKEKGLAYSVRGTIGSGLVYPGVAGFGLQTKSESMGQAIDAVLEVLEGMKTDAATDEEMERAKGSILNSFIFNYASKGQVLSQQMLYSFYGLPLDWLENYRRQIEAVTNDDVSRVAAAHLYPDKLKILVVGRAEEFDRPVESFGPVEVVDIAIPDPPVTVEAVAATDENRAAGAEVFGRGSGPGRRRADRRHPQRGGDRRLDAGPDDGAHPGGGLSLSGSHVGVDDHADGRAAPGGRRRHRLHGARRSEHGVEPGAGGRPAGAAQPRSALRGALRHRRGRGPGGGRGGGRGGPVRRRGPELSRHRHALVRRRRGPRPEVVLPRRSPLHRHAGGLRGRLLGLSRGRRPAGVVRRGDLGRRQPALRDHRQELRVRSRGRSGPLREAGGIVSSGCLRGHVTGG